ncbi:MAG: PAS domain S-box protein [Candidatus Bipolaricaulota bacterium]|nr:MAG: PAS domain S-box protein [Candidatus Bipolaricaulota bacterium]
MGDDCRALEERLAPLPDGAELRALIGPCLRLLVELGFRGAAAFAGPADADSWSLVVEPPPAGAGGPELRTHSLSRRVAEDLLSRGGDPGGAALVSIDGAVAEALRRALCPSEESFPSSAFVVAMPEGRGGWRGGLVAWTSDEVPDLVLRSSIRLCCDHLAVGCALLQRVQELEAALPADGNGKAALELARAHRDELFAGAPEAMALVDNDGRILRINEQFTALFGYTADEAEGEQIDRLLAPATFRDEALDTTGRVFRGESIALETVRRRKDGTDVLVAVLGTPVRFRGGQVAGYAIYRDISAQKASEEALRQSEERYRSIFASTTDAVLVFDREGRIVEANPQAALMYGYNAGEMVGIHASRIIHPDRFHGFRALEAAVRREGRLTRDSINVRKNGTAFDVEVHGASFELDGIPHLLAVVRDISQRVQVERKLEQTRHRIEQLHEAAHALAGCTQEADLYPLAIDAAERILSFNLCSVLIEEDGWLVYRGVTRQYEASLPARLPLDADGGIAAKTFLSKETSVLEDLRAVPEARPFHPGFISGISVPIGDVGVLQAVSTGLGGFSPQDARLAELLAGHVAETIRRLRLEAELRDQAMRDPLTGLYNRRHFNRVLEEEITHSTGDERSLAFLMIDVDRLKEINDTHGHQVGDRVLRDVAGILQASVRDIDTVVRYGGDEFLVVLPETGGVAEAAAGHIRSALAEWSRTRGESLVGFPLTLAIGLARLRAGEERPIQAVLAEADRRMYEAKREATAARGARSAHTALRGAR